MTMLEELESWSGDCILSAFYMCINFLLACAHCELHPTALALDDPPVDLRLHDFSLRHTLDLTCLAQVIRSVHAARHTANQYDHWTTTWVSNDLEKFASQTFGAAVGVKEVRDMVRDGRRLNRLEHESRNAFVGFVVALDWRRFQSTSDAQLQRMVRHLLALPAVQGLLRLLPAQWYHQSFLHYHG